MKQGSLVLENFNVEELSLEESKKVNGGAAPLVAIAAVAGGILLGVVVGAAIVVGTYYLVKWAIS